MYEPAFNSVLVEIDDKDAQWGSGNDDSMLGKSYSKGTIVKVGAIIDTEQHSTDDLDEDELYKLVDKQIMWNEGVEAGTVFEHDGKTYGFIYWWDIRGVLADNA